MKISVALAAYHGEPYIAAQLASILDQLGPADEVIISDDDPQGGTRAIVEAIAAADPRVRYLEGPGRGVTANFEFALRHCTGELLFLSDQDDVWLPGKVAAVTAAVEAGAALVLHDASVTDAALRVTEPSYFAVHGVSASLPATLLRNTFVGCCMAFTRDLLQAATPFPPGVPMHDWWIALVALRRKLPVTVLREPLLLWRRHGATVTGRKTSFGEKLRWRRTMLRALRKL